MKDHTTLTKWIVAQSLVPVDITDKASSLICTHAYCMHSKCDQSLENHPCGCI